VAKDIPLWVAVVIGLGPSVVAVVALVAAELRDRRRLAHEREMQLNNERRQAYATLARLTRGVDFHKLESVREVQEAYAMVELLGEDPKLLKIADDLVRTWSGAWRSARDAHEEGANPWDAPGYRNVANLVRDLRRAFIDRAREELGVEEGDADTPSRSIGELPDE
jgi:hypothetical protein